MAAASFFVAAIRRAGRCIGDCKTRKTSSSSTFGTVAATGVAKAGMWLPRLGSTGRMSTRSSGTQSPTCLPPGKAKAAAPCRSDSTWTALHWKPWRLCPTSCGRMPVLLSLLRAMARHSRWNQKRRQLPEEFQSRRPPRPSPQRTKRMRRRLPLRPGSVGDSPAQSWPRQPPRTHRQRQSRRWQPRAQRRQTSRRRQMGRKRRLPLSLRPKRLLRPLMTPRWWRLRRLPTRRRRQWQWQRRRKRRQRSRRWRPAPRAWLLPRRARPTPPELPPQRRLEFLRANRPSQRWQLPTRWQIPRQAVRTTRQIESRSTADAASPRDLRRRCLEGTAVNPWPQRSSSVQSLRLATTRMPRRKGHRQELLAAFLCLLQMLWLSTRRPWPKLRLRPTLPLSPRRKATTPRAWRAGVSLARALQA
mmetsp:Transcript_1167/g.1983  ORF Transcript_1167/g.1983 Transcript_1167/m.1983 type:complete len:416 (+) Transcript_1167:791-2038(+)